MSTPAFCTGSRVYGTPRDDSDLDLVIYVNDDQTERMLWEHGKLEKREELLIAADFLEENGFGEACEYIRLMSGGGIRFGRLNLVVTKSTEAHEAWKAVTDDLEARGPVTREEAVRAFTQALDVVYNEPPVMAEEEA